MKDNPAPKDFFAVGISYKNANIDLRGKFNLSPHESQSLIEKARALWRGRADDQYHLQSNRALRLCQFSTSSQTTPCGIE